MALDMFDLLPEPTEKLTMVSADIFRRYFELRGLSHSQVARRARMFRTNRPGHPDPTAVAHALKAKRVHYKTAVALCHGLNVDYHDAGV